VEWSEDKLGVRNWNWDWVWDPDCIWEQGESGFVAVPLPHSTPIHRLPKGMEEAQELQTSLLRVVDELHPQQIFSGTQHGSAPPNLIRRLSA
tara:strand:+ start:966 stop:1241 length:276 start_codon:yes stop_codon:yes gene_type:complete